ncbi:diguanylate cyclase [Leucobacter allii]|uniref:diguanylate cyclase domain-containing protein n=1 Tax=Leucobacter allii TaxID=2932247 RepID=UPI001FD111C9|nr:diguanylate cyclase [Leucobacter allii]UOR02642.1 diguanylate cyclase [Leucobacter allii]
MRWLSNRVRDQSPHSLFLIFATLLLALTVVVDLLFHTHLEHRWISWALLVFCLGCSAASFLSGRRVPRAIGIVGTIVFIAAQSYYLSLADDPQSVVASVQQLPIIAFYLGWFIAPRLAGLLIAACLLCFGTVMALNPLLHRDGILGVPVAVHALLTLAVCYGAGLYLWRRQLRAASTDSLTGALTRSGFRERLERSLGRAGVPGSFALVAIDFDGLKALNDRDGHAAGDAALTRTVMSWSTRIRGRDVIGRLGGDEFALLLPRTSAREAAEIVARLIEQGEHAWSWGIAEPLPGDTPETILDRADRALYAHKRRTRGASEAGAAPDAAPTASIADPPASDTDGGPARDSGPKRDAESGTEAVPVLRAAAEAFLRRQSPFSLVTGTISLVLAIVFAADLAIGHPHFQFVFVVVFMSVYALGAILPFALGRRFPRWAGFAMVLVSAAWSSFLLLNAQHLHASVNALLELPLTALYVAWFFARPVAYCYMAFTVARVSLTLVWNPEFGGGQVSGIIVIAYAILIAVFCFGGAIAVRRQVRHEELTDPLTSALNRRGLLLLSPRLRARAEREGDASAIAIIDFDDFKQLNDEGGHAAGDAALRDSAGAWAGAVGMRAPFAKNLGLVARLGGDEFAVLLRGDAEAAEAMIRRLRKASPYRWSWGIAELVPGEELDGALERADAELYRAKRRR